MDAAHEAERGEVRSYGRRTFLITTGVGLSSLLWGATAWHTASKVVVPVVDAFAPGLIPGWRIYTVASSMPTFDPATWRLHVDGLVDRELELTYEQLRSLPRAEQVSNFRCVTGWSVDNVHWAGVRFADLLALISPHPEARALTFTSAERPYVDSLSLDEARYPDAMLAYELDGKPLTRAHGAPVRLVMPKMYGYKGVKWVERITLEADAAPGYWEQRGYDSDAWIGGSPG